MIAEIVTCRTELDIPVAVACRALDVSVSRFYKHRSGEVSPARRRRDELDAVIAKVFAEQSGEYGSPRIHAELVDEHGYEDLSVNTVAQRMKAKGLRAKRKRRGRSLTKPDPSAPKFSNLLKRNFKPVAMNVSWVGDITEIETWEGKLYLATVIDLWSRRLIGFAVDDNCKAPLVCDAMRMALATRGGREVVAGVVFHSDRGPVNTPPGRSRHYARRTRSRSQCHGRGVVLTTPRPKRSSRRSRPNSSTGQCFRP